MPSHYKEIEKNAFKHIADTEPYKEKVKKLAKAAEYGTPAGQEEILRTQKQKEVGAGIMADRRAVHATAEASGQRGGVAVRKEVEGITRQTAELSKYEGELAIQDLKKKEEAESSLSDFKIQTVQTDRSTDEAALGIKIAEETSYKDARANAQNFIMALPRNKTASKESIAEQVEAHLALSGYEPPEGFEV